MDRIYRLDLIKEILNEYVLSNQDEIQAVLSKKGVHVTQATLSRDLKSLRVSRVTDSNGKTRYALQDATSSLYEKRELPDHLDGVISIEFSGQLGVVKTIPGFANAVAYYIDQVKIPEILGTIAGDDTILLIAKAEVSGNHLAGILLNNFGGLSEKFK